MSDANDPLAEIKQTYFQECDELSVELERGLMAIDAGERDAEVINSIFRAVHSIKGGAGAFGFDSLVDFAHEFESVLDEVRSGTRALEPDLVRTLLLASDLLADLVREAKGGAPVDAERSRTLIASFAKSDGGPAEMQPAPAPAPTEPAAPLSAAPFDLSAMLSNIAAMAKGPEEEAPKATAWRIRFVPTADLYARANEPAIIIRELAGLGRAEIEVDCERVPSIVDLDPENSYLGWTIRLETEKDRAAIADVFSFCEDDCFLDIREDVPSAADASPDLLDEEPAPQAAAADPFSAFDLPPMEVEEAPVPVPAPVKLEARPPAAPAAAAEPAAPVQPAAPARSGGATGGAAPQSIRVELERIDRLVDVVGELVINQAMLAQQINDCDIGRGSPAMKSLEELEYLTRDLQESVMAIRAQPMRSVFQRMPRLVREVAAACGKTVQLVMEGEGTEVDKTVIERLADPITHMLRNAIDHGLESADRRLAAGKSADGTIRMSAAHRSGRIVIEVSDDGGGIDRHRVLAIAMKKGLVAEDAALTDEEIDNLIFLPGFSTAATVSDISGRGVGMDVVRSSIQALGGRISIASRPGEGSTFTLTLPLTLAVLDGMIVTVANQTLVVPLTSVTETLQPKSSNIRYLGEDAPLVHMRDAHIPLLDVGRRLGYRAEPLLPTAGVLLIVEDGSRRAALLVDAIQGQRQVVIKSLEANYGAVEGIAAATILGDGRIALILDVDAVIAPSAQPEFDMAETRLRAAG